MDVYGLINFPEMEIGYTITDLIGKEMSFVHAPHIIIRKEHMLENVNM
jgi:hypothetical protein